jgi:YbbR domain-containing protein
VFIYCYFFSLFIFLKALFNSVRVTNNSQTFFKKEDNRSSQITDVSINDVYREQRRYESFWEGVNRGIYLDSINPKLIDGNKNKRALTLKKVKQYILEDLFVIIFTILI